MKKILAFVLAMMMVLGMSSAMADGAIKVAVIGPLTGGAAVYGNAVNNAVLLAAEELNAKGGIQIEVISEDDTHDAEVAINAYNNAMDAGAQLIIGTVTTNPCIAVSAQAFEERVFMLTPSASSALVTADKDNCYQLCFTDPAQGTLSAQYIADNQLGTKVGVIYNNADAYSTGIYQTFVAEAAAKNLEIVATTTFTDETTDFSVQVAAMKDAGADVVFLPIYYTPASMILTQAKTTDYAPVFFGVDGMDGILTLEGFNAELAEGVMLLTPFAADATDDLTVNFVTKYVEKYGEIPNQFAADGYDCVYAVAAACEAAGVTAETPYEEVCEAMIATFSGDFTVTGLTGTMTWSDNGEVAKTPNAVIIKNGAYVSPENY